MKEGQHVPSHSGTLRKEPRLDVEIAALADRQHGVVALRQLREVGLSASGVRSRVARGRLHPVHRAVYAVGRSKLTGHGHWMAVVLACGPSAVLSHRSAAGLWGLRRDSRRKNDISLPSPSARAKQAIDVHRSVTLTADDVTPADGIPCTSVARTLVDLGEVQRAIERAGPRRTGILLSVLEELDGTTLTETDLEEAFLALCRAAALPSPEVNVWMTLPDGTPARIASFGARSAWRLRPRWPLSPHSTIQGAGRETGPAAAAHGLRAGPLHRPAGGEGAPVGQAVPNRADSSAATASVPRRCRRIPESWGAGCVTATARRRPPR